MPSSLLNSDLRVKCYALNSEALSCWKNGRAMGHQAGCLVLLARQGVQMASLDGFGAKSEV